MPPKKKQPQTITKASAAAKQIVNVKIGDTVARRRSKRPRRGGGGGGGGEQPPRPMGMEALGVFSRGLPVATQSLGVSMTAPANAEYNMLLRALAEEKSARERAAAPLMPNTAPLTTNEQRNELLSHPDLRTPMTPIVEKFSRIIQTVAANQMYDDPLIDENKNFGAARLAENIEPRLPVSNFDVNDVVAYDDEDFLEQEALGDSVSKGQSSAKPPKSGSKYEAVSKAYENYAEYIKYANKQYGINEPIKARRNFTSQVGVSRELDRVKDLVEAVKVSRK